MSKDLHYCILGLGISGIACLDFLVAKHIKKITAVDLKQTPELLQLTNKYPSINFVLGKFTIPINADILIISPGIDPTLPAIQQAINRGAKLTNDVNLFLEHINILKQTKLINIAAVTGTNGKTTVVNMLANMAKQAGIKYALCGNVGEPVLKYINQEVSLYILELSSFQLELIDELSCQQIFDVACILNITPDHLDRYIKFADYCAAKLNIFKQAKNIVYLLEDPNINLDLLNITNNSLLNINLFGTNYNTIFSSNTNLLEHKINNTKINYFTLTFDSNNQQWLTKSLEPLLKVEELALQEEHNILNALACLAIGDLLNISMPHMFQALKKFTGLDHRCQKITTSDSINWINDSKGTNIGATIAALNTTIKNSKTKLIIILGGINKNADLSILKPHISAHCKVAILIGSCKEQLFELLKETLDCYLATDLKMAVTLAKKVAASGDTILFSPACASFDMFNNYKHRGETFKQCILELNNESST